MNLLDATKKIHQCLSPELRLWKELLWPEDGCRVITQTCLYPTRSKQEIKVAQRWHLGNLLHKNQTWSYLSSFGKHCGLLTSTSLEKGQHITKLARPEMPNAPHKPHFPELSLPLPRKYCITVSSWRSSTHGTKEYYRC